MQQTFPVSDTNPIFIDPAGLSIRKTVFNTGAETVYLTETPTGSSGFPLSAGNSLGWEPKTPMYAYVDAGAPTTIIVTDTAIVQPQNNISASVDGNVGVTGGQLVAQGTVENLFNQTKTGTTPFSGTYIACGLYQTLMIGYNASYSGSAATDREDFRITWWTLIGGSYYRTGIDEFSFRPDFGSPSTAAYANIRVKGTHFDVESTATITGAILAVRVCTISGTMQALPEQWHSGGPTSAGTAFDRTWRTTVTTLAIGAQAQFYIPTYDGAATLAFASFAATNTGSGIIIEVKRYTGDTVLLTTSYNSQAFAGLQIQTHLPRDPLYLQLNNQSNAALNAYFALMMEGNR